MEKVDNLVAVPYTSKWSDLGGWDAVWLEGQTDEFGNVNSENAHTISCLSLMRSENRNQQIVGLGLKDVIAVAMQDAVLVMHKDYAQQVKRVVELLKTKILVRQRYFQRS